MAWDLCLHTKIPINQIYVGIAEETAVAYIGFNWIGQDGGNGRYEFIDNRLSLTRTDGRRYNEFKKVSGFQVDSGLDRYFDALKEFRPDAEKSIDTCVNLLIKEYKK